MMVVAPKFMCGIGFYLESEKWRFEALDLDTVKITEVWGF